MARFRKIDSRILNDEKFCALSDDAQLIFLTLLIHPHMTSLGAMRANLCGLAAEKRWSFAKFRKAFAQIASKGMAQYDDKASFLWLPNFLKYNRPENPNVIKSWTASYDLLPECALKKQLLNRVKELVEDLPEGFREAFTDFERVCQRLSKGYGEGFRKSMPNQEQEPEQEPEPNPDPETGPDIKENNKRKKTGSTTTLPEGFGITDAHRDFAKAHKYRSPDLLLAGFCDHHLARGSKFVDWDRAFQTWIRNDTERFGNNELPVNQKFPVRREQKRPEMPRFERAPERTPEQVAETKRLVGELIKKIG
jgi:hypothetical protein